MIDRCNPVLNIVDHCSAARGYICGCTIVGHLFLYSPYIGIFAGLTLVYRARVAMLCQLLEHKQAKKADEDCWGT